MGSGLVSRGLWSGLCVALALAATAFVAAAPARHQDTYDSLRLAGRAAPPIDVLTLKGAAARVTYSGLPTLLYVFVPTLLGGSGNTASMNALFTSRSKQYRFVGLSLRSEHLPEYLAANPLPFEVFTFKNYHDPALSSYGFGASPCLYLVSIDSKVQRAWCGLFTGPTKTDAEKFFGVTLPGTP